MRRDEHKNIIQQLIGMVTAENQATASELLTTLSEDYNQTLDSYEESQTNVQNLTERNETLRNVNTQLFLKVGATEKAIHKDESQPDKQEENIPSFDTLFNEKGELI